VDILNLPGWRVIGCEERDDQYRFVALPASLMQICPHCEKLALLKHGTDKQEIRDLPCHGRSVIIAIEHQRFRCKNCKKTCYLPLVGIDTKRFMTERLVTYIERKTISTNRTFASIAEEIGVDPRTIRNVFDDAVAKRKAQSPFETPAILGIDELHILGAGRFVMTNMEAHTLVELLEDRRKTTIIHALRQFKQPDQIRTVVIDLWKPYRDAVQHVLPDAVIVCDKFHVLKLATTALEGFRKQICATLSGAQRKTLKMHDRFLLLRRVHDLEPEDRFVLEAWTQNYPLLGQAHQFKEQFFQIYDHSTREEALSAYFTWMDSMPVELRPVYWPLMLTIEEWGDHIFAHFDRDHITGGFVESANSVARVLERMGRGYSLPVLRARLLYGWNRKQAATDEKTSATGVDEHEKGVPISTLVGQG
jgi:transposase